jgi:hypothetical protein
MRAANMTYSIGLTMSHCGKALITMVTPDDPSDDDWSDATAIVRQIVSRRLDGIRLRSANLCNGERADERRRNSVQCARV